MRMGRIGLRNMRRTSADGRLYAGGPPANELPACLEVGASAPVSPRIRGILLLEGVGPERRVVDIAFVDEIGGQQDRRASLVVFDDTGRVVGEVHFGVLERAIEIEALVLSSRQID